MIAPGTTCLGQVERLDGLRNAARPSANRLAVAGERERPTRMSRPSSLAFASSTRRRRLADGNRCSPERGSCPGMRVQALDRLDADSAFVLGLVR